MSVVVLGSSLSGVLVSLSLSRAGIDHILVGGEEPAAVPRLGEALTDCASPELWRLYGREFPDCFYYKSHISIMNGNFATLIQLANPRRSPERVAAFSPEKGKPGYPWLGDGLFHLDRIAFDKAVYRKAIQQKPCRFISAKIEHVSMEGDRVSRIDLQGADAISDPRYVFDCSRGLVAEAIQIETDRSGAAAARGLHALPARRHRHPRSRVVAAWDEPVAARPRVRRHRRHGLADPHRQDALGGHELRRRE